MGIACSVQESGRAAEQFEAPHAQANVVVRPEFVAAGRCVHAQAGGEIESGRVPAQVLMG